MAEVEDYSQPKQGISPDSELILQKHSNFGNSSHNLRTSESAVAGTYIVFAFFYQLIRDLCSKNLIYK